MSILISTAAGRVKLLGMWLAVYTPIEFALRPLIALVICFVFILCVFAKREIYATICVTCYFWDHIQLVASVVVLLLHIIRLLGARMKTE